MTMGTVENGPLFFRIYLELSTPVDKDEIINGLINVCAYHGPSFSHMNSTTMVQFTVLVLLDKIVVDE